MVKKEKTLCSELLRMIIISNIAVTCILGFIFTVIVFRETSHREKEDMDFYMESIQEQFAGRLQFLEEGVTYLRENDEMLDFFQGNTVNEDAILDQLEQGVNLFSEQNMISETYPVVRDFYVFNKNMQYVGTHFYPETMSEKQSMNRYFQECLENYKDQDQIFYYRQHGSLLDLCFALYDNDMKVIGYCAAAIEKESLARIFRPLEKYESYYWILKDNRGKEVSGLQLAGLDTDQMKKQEGTIKCEGKKYYYRQVSHSFGLTSYILIPGDKLYLLIRPMLMMCWAIVLISFIAVMAAVLFFSVRMTKPLENISQRIKQFGTGDFETSLEEFKIREFQEISDSFNDMTKRIDQLIREVYENQILAREARIQYIQSQMNPHFMFNVLSMISMRLKKNKDEELYRMVTSFSGLMQGKIFRKGEIEIPLEDEMEIVEFYLYLQGQRFRDMVQYDIVWESEDLKKCKIPRLSVEPLVENSMIHGLEPKGEEGYIHVEIKTVQKEEQKERKLLIIVEDDGVGFDIEKWNLQVKEEGGHPRVGIMNIQRLIKNLYGDSYGLKVESKPGRGTYIELLLPLTMENLINI